ncbi:MAG: hypothetical protein ACXVCG_02240 [Bdellovibrionota bacterium]
MKNLQRILLLTGLAAVCSTQCAHAEFSFACGALREKGADRAEIAFVEGADSMMKFYFSGKQVPDEKFGFKGLLRGQWVASVDQGVGKPTRKFLFTHGAKASSVQESLVNEKGPEKKVGGKKACVYREEEAAPKKD